jgi:putative CocE/NonD family hydrolase
MYDPLQPFHGLGGAMIGPNAGTFKQPEVIDRSDVLIYDTETLKKATEVTGYPKLILNVATTALNTDFSARILDVFPDGSSFNISEGIVRKRFKQNSPTDIAIQLWPTSYLFKEGHKIRLEISSSNFPRFDRNFNSEDSGQQDAIAHKAKQTIFYGQSQLVLPLINVE